MKPNPPEPSSPDSAAPKTNPDARHWPRATADDPSDDRPLCQNPGCTRRVERAAQGRPRKYCRDSCRSASRSARTARSAPDADVHDAYAQDVLRDIRSRSAALGRPPSVGGDDVIARIAEAHRLARDADDLMGALVQQARDRKVPMRDIAAALNISPDTVRRHWPARRIDDRMRERLRRGQLSAPTQRAPRGQRKQLGPDVSREGVARPSRPRTNGGGAGGEDPPDERVIARLARALSHLQRSSGKPLRALAVEAGVSPSYVSRVLSGERCPSWPVTRRLILACSGDPADLRPLWDTARGNGYPARQAPDAATLHAALRGLHLAAARPAPDDIRRSSRGTLSLEEISQLLYGPRVPDWTTVDRFVRAIHGRCDDIRPLWDAVTALDATAGPAANP